MGAGPGGPLGPVLEPWLAAGAPLAGPSYVATIETSVAFAAAPSPATATFSNVVPSTGWLMLSVGASVGVNGTVRTPVTGSWACLAVSGSVAAILHLVLAV